MKHYTLEDYWKGVLKYTEKHPQQRWGQAAFNYLSEIRPDLSEQVRGTEMDPFYAAHAGHASLINFNAFIRLNW